MKFLTKFLLLTFTSTAFCADVPYYNRAFDTKQDIGAINQNFRDLVDRKDLLSDSDKPSQYEKCLFSPMFCVNQYDSKINIKNTSIYISTTSGSRGICFQDGTCQITAGVASSTISVNTSQFFGNGSVATPLNLVVSSVTLQGNTFNGISQLLKLDDASKVPIANLPIDGYAATYVNTSGDTMSGGLTSSSWGNYASSMSASAFYGDGSNLTGKVSKTGDTMTGQLTVQGASVTVGGALGASGNTTLTGDVFNYKAGLIYGLGTQSRVGIGTVNTMPGVKLTIGDDPIQVGYPNPSALGIYLNEYAGFFVSNPTQYVTRLTLGNGGLIPYIELNNYTGNTGSINFSTGVRVSGGLSVGANYASTATTLSLPSNGLIVEGNVGIATTTPQGLLHVGAGAIPGLLVTSSGNVGIGTTAPASLLEIYKDGAPPNAQDVIKFGSTSSYYGFLGHSKGDSTYVWAGNNNAVNAAQFGIRMKGNTIAEQVLTVLGSGEVGIGSTTPIYKLDVTGGGHFTSSMTVDGGIITSTSVSAAYYQILGSTFIANLGPITGNSQNSLYLGLLAGANNTGTTNTFIGHWAGRQSTTSSDNTLVGSRAGEEITTGTQNTFIGKSAGHDNTTASGNTFIGTYTGANNITGVYNSCVGGGACGYFSASGNPSSSTVIGYLAGYKLTSGAGNIFIGYDAGQTTTLGSDNIIIGVDEYASAATASDELNIGGLIKGYMASPATATVYGNFYSTGIVSASNGLIGTIQTAAQSNITSLGTLTGLSVSSNTTAVNFPGSGIWNASGNVGIGNLAPKAKLSLGVPGSPAFLAYSDGGIHAGWFYDVPYSGNQAITTWHGGDLVFGKTTNNTTPTFGTEFIHIKNATGNVGIGIAAPLAKLSLGVPGSPAFLTYSAADIHTGWFYDVPNATDQTIATWYGGDLVFGKTAANTTPTFGTELMRIKNAGGVIVPSGNVGIGTTAPASLLEIYKDGAAPNAQDVIKFGATSSYYGFLGHSKGDSTYIWLGNNYNSNAAQFGLRMKGNTIAEQVLTVLGSGSVGIGTTNPAAKLHLVGASGTPNINMILGADTYINRGTSDGSDNGLLGFASGGQWGGSYGAGIQTMGNEYSTAGNGRGRILLMAGNVSSNTTDGTIMFATGAELERMRIDTAGNVGIGTTNPTSKLEIAGNVISTGTLVIQGAADSSFVGNVAIGIASAGGAALSVVGDGTFRSAATADYNTLELNSVANNPQQIFTSYAGANAEAGLQLGVYSKKTAIHISPVTGYIAISSATPSPAVALDVSGFTRLGDNANAPKIKMVKVSTETSSGAGDYAQIAHGVTASKIIGAIFTVDVLGSGFAVGPNVDEPANWEYNSYYDNTYCVFRTDSANSASIRNKPATCTIFYIE